MKLTVLLALAATLVFFLWKRRTSPVLRIEGPAASWIIPDEWSIGTGEKDGKPVIVRFNSGIQPLIGNPAFPGRLGITVTFEHPTEQGFPEPGEDASLSGLEEELRRRFCADNESLFAAVITAGGIREFVFYTSNTASARAKVESLAEETKHHRIQYSINDDPEWNVYRTLTSR